MTTMTIPTYDPNDNLYAHLVRKEPQMSRSNIAAGYEMLWSHIRDIFTPSGMTHDGTLDDNSSRVLPEPDELVFVPDQDGHAMIMRSMGGTMIPLAAAKVNATAHDTVGGAYKATALAGPKWIQYYTFVGRSRRSEMLGIDDPCGNWTDERIQAVMDAENQKYASKVIMRPKAGSQGVTTGVSEAGVKRITWQGHAGFALARWMGANGWSGKEAVATYARLGITLGKSAIIGGVYAGKSGTRGDPAPVTPDQARTLEAARLAAGGATKPMSAILLMAPPASNGTVRANPNTTSGVSIVDPEPLSKRALKKLAKDAKLDAAIKARKAAGKK